MKRRINALIFLLCTLNVPLFSQNQLIDSLKNRLESPHLSSGEKYAVYAELIEKYRGEQEYDRAVSYAEKFLRYAKQKSNTAEITKAYTLMGIIYINQKNYEQSNLYIDSSGIYASRSNDVKAQVYASYLKAYQYYYFGEREKVMSYLLNSLSKLDKTEEDLYLSFRINYLMYCIYSSWDDAENSFKYALKSCEIAKKSGNKDHLSNAYSALSVSYTYKYGKTNDPEDLQLVFDYAEKACLLYNEFPGRVTNYSYAIARNNYASYLLKYTPELTTEIRKKAEFNANESLKIAKITSDNQQLQAANYGILSDLALLDNNPEKAEKYLLQAQATLLTQQPVYYPLMSKIAYELANLYEQQGKLSKALEYQKKLTEYNNKLFDQDQAETARKLEAEYQFEKKENELKLLKEKTERQHQEKLLYIILGVIGVISSIFMVRSYHYKLKFSREREKQLNTEKNEAELQVKLEKEEQSRLKAEQALLTLQQQKLQDEVLANQLHLQHKNKVLKQLKEKLSSEESSVTIQQMIREEIHVDNNFEHARFQIQELHPNFFNSLNEHAVQKLTPLDLKYCAYIYLGMDTKQIAKLLHVEPKSVRMTKYRLKKKFNLSEETDLAAFINKLNS